MAEIQEIQVFNFDGRSVRLVGTAAAPEWIAQDVCEALGLGNAAMALDGFEPDEKGDISTADITGRVQQMLTLTEPGLYRLIFRSRKPEAARFRRWVTHEVLPTIRRTGAYALPGAAVLPAHLAALERAHAQALALATTAVAACQEATRHLVRATADLRRRLPPATKRETLVFGRRVPSPALLALVHDLTGGATTTIAELLVRARERRLELELVRAAGLERLSAVAVGQVLGAAVQAGELGGYRVARLMKDGERRIRRWQVERATPRPSAAVGGA